MRLGSVAGRDVSEELRLDARFFIDRAFLRGKISERWPRVSVAELFGKGKVVLPNIFERIPASDEQFGKPILVPYDPFRYVPYSTYILSRQQVPTFERLQITRGTLLVVCSGRNLGPVTFVDRYLEQFVLSHDMIRIEANASEDLFYFAALMHTDVGRALVRRDRNGSVIDHLDANQLAALEVPVVDEVTRKKCAAAFQIGFEKREAARLSLQALSRAFLRGTGFEDYVGARLRVEASVRFSVPRSRLFGRFDCAPYTPNCDGLRARMKARTIGDLAVVRKPKGRYKTLYVDSEDHGVRLLSGRQVAQLRPISLKVMSPKAWEHPEEYLLSKGMILVTADGRAEENLADCAMVGADRDGWAASGHVHRLEAREGVNPGLLYLACASSPTQGLLKSLATGSVVDALSEDDVASVPVPWSAEHGEELGDAAVAAWSLFSEASLIEDAATMTLEHALQLA